MLRYRGGAGGEITTSSMCLYVLRRCFARRASLLHLVRSAASLVFCAAGLARQCPTCSSIGSSPGVRLCEWSLRSEQCRPLHGPDEIGQSAMRHVCFIASMINGPVHPVRTCSIPYVRVLNISNFPDVWLQGFVFLRWLYIRVKIEQLIDDENSYLHRA